MSSYKNILVLTGSGISAESGLATFRDAKGIWAKYDYREVATPEGFATNPALVHEFYNLRRKEVQKVAPNAAHLALADLESHLQASGGTLTLVTQNVDDLHARAGSKAILPMHGELLKTACMHCGARHEWTGDVSVATSCPACAEQGGLRPDVVWFGEMPRYMEEIAGALAVADLFVSIGTSGSVYPAAGLVAEARGLGVETLELNLDPSENASLFSSGSYGPATDIVPQWVERLIHG